jgi:hypothetical protein
MQVSNLHRRLEIALAQKTRLAMTDLELLSLTFIPARLYLSIIIPLRLKDMEEGTA